MILYLSVTLSISMIFTAIVFRFGMKIFEKEKISIKYTIIGSIIAWLWTCLIFFLMGFFLSKHLSLAATIGFPLSVLFQSSSFEASAELDGLSLKGWQSLLIAVASLGLSVLSGVVVDILL